MSKYIVVIILSLLIIVVSFFDFRPKSYSTAVDESETLSAKHTDDNYIARQSLDSKEAGVISDVEEVSETTDFVYNKNSKKYHLSSCRYAESIKSENQGQSSDISALEAEGYLPCKACIK